MSLAHKMSKRVDPLFTESQIEEAAIKPPSEGRARLRGHAVRGLVQVIKGSWGSLVIDPGGKQLLRMRLPEPDERDNEEAVEAARRGEAEGFIAKMRKEK